MKIERKRKSPCVAIYDTIPLLRVLVPRTSHSGPSDHLYLDFHPPTLPNTFYLLLSSISLPRLLLSSTLLLFLSYTCSFLPLFFSGTGSYYTLRMDFSSIISNFPPFVSNIPYHISCCPIHRAIWLYTF